ncbi:MAG TPA: acyl-CoA dehydrogenase family protein [Thermohalobaculum sp.]|nr:acyl-CoA dehydrogenase family protein [Thermohalobaculum sp.]
MNLGMSDRVKPLVEQVRAMIADEIAPADAEFHAEIGKAGDRFMLTDRQVEILDGLKAKARERGLWNFWLTNTDRGPGLTNVEYAYLAEEMGKVRIGAEVFNCSAPDTGNMEVFHHFGTEEHKERWLKPLLAGEIRSAFLMTEPDVASSDATNISLEARRDGDAWLLNGEKWWASGAGDPRCKVYIVMARSNPEGDRHHQHSQFVVPAGTEGVEVLRPMTVFGHDDAPHGHMHVRLTDVRVPERDHLLGTGRGFEVSQARLGPGRIHHCMRSIGQAEQALEFMCRRSLARTAFGQPIARLGGNYDVIADARMGIEQARLLCLKAAWVMDTEGVRAAQPWISMIKVEAPRVALKIVDDAIQMHGAAGISQDTPLADMWAKLRTMRIVDGPDAVHRRQVARRELRQYANERV